CLLLHILTPSNVQRTEAINQNGNVPYPIVSHVDQGSARRESRPIRSKRFHVYKHYDALSRTYMERVRQPNNMTMTHVIRGIKRIQDHQRSQSTLNRWVIRTLTIAR